MNTAQKGATLEREIRQLLEAAGWSVIRGAGSKGEVAMPDGDQYKTDLLATKYTKQTIRELWIVAVQAKVKKVKKRGGGVRDAKPVEM